MCHCESVISSWSVTTDNFSLLLCHDETKVTLSENIARDVWGIRSGYTVVAHIVSPSYTI